MQNKCDRFIELLNKIQEKKKGDDIQQYFADVAKYLFEHVAIEAGGKTFTFAEVEFYYYKEGDFEGPLYNCTYPRTRDVGKFFWHYSGMDICFESSEEKKYFGGILIRSIKNENEIIAGPMRCSDVIMNSCNGEMPRLVDHETKCEIKEPITRYGIEADKTHNEAGMKLRYYIKQESWNRIRNNVMVADKTTGRYRIVPQKTDYYTAKPK
jgi:hypothetical protein